MSDENVANTSAEVAMLPGVDRTDEIYARAIELAYGPSRRQARGQLVLNAIYYGMILLIVGWIYSMAVDRDPPVKQTLREMVNPGGKVRVRERLLVHGIRDRNRSCELTRR